MTTRDLLQMALDALKSMDHETTEFDGLIVEIRAHLAKPDETAELLREMGEALENLERVKGRHHTEQAYNRCMDALVKYRERMK
jgi:hypothetical protein